MTCTITIIPPIKGIVVGGVLTSIEVRGKADNCRVVDVRLNCDSVELTQTGVVVDPVTNEWSAIFDDIVEICQCDAQVNVTVVCSDGDEDCGRDGSFIVDCEPEEPVCPTVTLSSLIIGDCNSDGTTTISIGTTVTSTAPFSAELRDSLGVVLASGSGGPGSLSLSGSGNYSGTVNFSVNILSPDGCSGMTIPITVPSCAKCPDVATSYTLGGCDGSGMRTVDISVMLDSPDTFTAELRDTSDTVLTSGTGTSVNLTHSTSLPEGSTETYKVVITSNDVCSEVSFDVNVIVCDCPTVSFNSSVSNCDSDGNRTVTMEAMLNSATLTYSAELRDNSDAVVDSVTGGSGTVTLSHTVTVPGDGSTSDYKVVITDPSECGEFSNSVDVPVCDDGGGGDGGFCGNFWCCILCGIWALLLAGYIVALATCVLSDPLSVAIASGVLAAVGGLFIGLCGACAWARCTIIGVILGVVGAIIALIFSEGITTACLIAAGSVAFGFLVAALGILGLGDC